ncbi:MAG: hypothetical protein FWD49_07110 [Firmicutes bacterium]|nr:hypothetical protein [Bacillota bacterium]
MKKQKLLISIILILSLCVAVLFACANEGGGVLPAKEIGVETEADFLNIKNYLGERYKNYTFVLKNDLTFEADEWTPIGGSIENSFRGKLKSEGSNKTIRLIQNSYDYLPLYRSAFGIFGYAYNAEFNNINIEVDIKFAQFATTVFAGGLAGMAYGSVKAENITFDTRMHIVPETESEREPETDEAKDALYAGGIFGACFGKAEIKSVAGEFSLTNTDAVRFGSTFVFAHLNTYAGAVTGTVKPIGATYLADERDSLLENAYVFANYTLTAHNIFAGGLLGAGYNIHMENAEVEGNGAFKLFALNRALVGGIAGLMSNADLLSASVKRDFDIRADYDSAVTVGGIAGYAINSSHISDCDYEGEIELWLRGFESFAGGLVGVLSNSELENSYVLGGFSVIAVYKTADSLAELARGGYALYMFKNLGGAVGKMFGGAFLNEVNANFISFQPLVSQFGHEIEVIMEDDKPVDIALSKSPEVKNCTAYKNNSASHIYQQSGGNVDMYLPINLGEGEITYIED